jgi:uncharacterized protein (DUF1800 family)
LLPGKPSIKVSVRSGAHHIALRIATYFVADDPPKPLIDRMAEAFQLSDGDIATVLRAMVDAPEFASAQGGKFKDPLRYVLSAVRLAYGDKPILNTGPIQGWQSHGGRALQSPDARRLSEREQIDEEGGRVVALRTSAASQIPQ